MLESFSSFFSSTGVVALFQDGAIDAIKIIIMLAVACVLLYLAIVKQFEPLLLAYCVRYAFDKPADDKRFKRNNDAY